MEPLRAYKKARRPLSQSREVGRFLYSHTTFNAPGPSMKVVDSSASILAPREIPQIFESLGRRSVSDGFWDYYKVDVENAARNPQERLLRFVSDIRDFLQPTGIALSVGCGFGVQEILLSFLCPDLEIVGVDILDDKRAETKIRSMKVVADHVRADRVSPLLADGGRLPFRDCRFDYVIAIDSLSHADYMRADRDLETSQSLLLSEMSRVVRPWGHLAVVENSSMSPRNVMRKSGTSCHPVNPFYLGTVLERLGHDDVRILPYYDLSGRTDLRARAVNLVLKHSNALGILLAPLFMLSARKRPESPRHSQGDRARF